MSIYKLTPHINVDEALARLINDEDLFYEVLGLMLKEFFDTKQEIHTQIKSKATSNVKNKAHYFKGIASNLSAKRFAGLASTIETCCGENDWIGAEAAFDLLIEESNQIHSIYIELNPN